MNAVGELADLIREAAGNTVAFTGAGVSVPSGIRGFRGRNGVFADTFRGYRVEELFGIDLFDSDPSLFYAWAKDFVYAVDAYRPNAVHNVLAGLGLRGLLHAVVTQNIDRLHTVAGSPTVYEIHGSPEWHRCRRCGRAYAYAEVRPTAHAGKVPHCACGGVLKPDIVFYGEALPERVLQDALKACMMADLCLVLGSSLTVYPAASLPEEAYRCGARIVVVNDTPTPLDRRALLHFSDLTDTFVTLGELLDIPR